MSISQLRLARLLLLVVVNFIFLKSVVCFTGKSRTALSFVWSGSFALVVLVYFLESRQTTEVAQITWFTTILVASTSLSACWLLCSSSRATRERAACLLAGLFFLFSLHALARPVLTPSLLLVLRLSFV